MQNLVGEHLLLLCPVFRWKRLVCLKTCLVYLHADDVLRWVTLCKPLRERHEVSLHFFEGTCFIDSCIKSFLLKSLICFVRRRRTRLQLAFALLLRLNLLRWLFCCHCFTVNWLDSIRSFHWLGMLFQSCRWLMSWRRNACTYPSFARLGSIHMQLVLTELVKVRVSVWNFVVVTLFF